MGKLKDMDVGPIPKEMNGLINQALVMPRGRGFQGMDFRYYVTYTRTVGEETRTLINQINLDTGDLEQFEVVSNGGVPVMITEDAFWFKGTDQDRCQGTSIFPHAGKWMSLDSNRRFGDDPVKMMVCMDGCTVPLK